MVKKIKTLHGLTIIELAIVIFLLSLSFAITYSALRNISLFRTSQGEAETLKDMYRFSKFTSIRSGQIIYMDFDLDNNSYRIYRINRDKEVKEQTLVERNLFVSGKILGIQTPFRKEIQSGVFTVSFFPDGSSDEIYIYLGSGDTVKNTVIYPRYGLEAKIMKARYEGAPKDILKLPESE